MKQTKEPGTRADIRLILKRMLFSKPAIIATAALAAYTLVGFFLAPYLVKRYVPMILEKRFHTPAAIGGVRMNPFLMTAEVNDFNLAERSGRSLVGFRRLFLNFQTSSLVHWAWTFREVELDSPVANIVIEKDGGINLAALLPPRQGPKPQDESQNAEPEESAPPRILLYNVRIQAGEIDITDMRQSQPALLAIRPLDVTLSNISTLPEREGPYILEAKTADGESFRWEGGISFAPLRSTGTLAFEDIRAASLWEFARDAVNLSEPGGILDAKMRYTVTVGANQLDAAVSDLQVRLSDISLQLENDPDPFFASGEVALENGRFDLAGREMNIGKLSVRGGRLSTRVGREGKFRLQDMVRPSEKKTPAQSQPPNAAAWTLNVEQAAVDDFGIAFADMSREPSAMVEAEKIHLSSAASAVVGPGGTQVRFEALESRIEGARVGLTGASRPIVDIPGITVESGAFDLAAHSLTVGGIELTGGMVTVVREEEGDINLMNLIAPKKLGTVREKRIQDSQEGTPWRFMAQKIRLADFRSSLTDVAANPDNPVLDLEGISVELQNVDGRSPTDFSLAMTVAQGGRLSAKGTIDPGGPALDASVEVADLDITPLQPYIEAFVDLTIASGRVSTNGTLVHGAAGSSPRTAYTGKVQVDSLQLVENPSGETLLGWAALQTSQVRLELMPNQLTIDDINLSQPAGKLFIAEDGSVNIVKLIKTRGTVKPSTDEASENSGGGGVEFPVQISKVRIAEGMLDFADLGLIPPFATEIRELDGVVIGMSSTKDARAQVQLEGRVDEYGSAKIEGEINTFDPKGFTDISMIFSNVEMTGLSPYSGKFAGRRIDSGKISLDLKYNIQDSALMGENQIVVEQLILGEKVDSPDAANLPLDLAVALMQDSSGVINIGLPVSGNLDDPEFSYGHLVWKAISNLITKIVTAPFRALGALLGIEGDALDAIAFEAGSAEVAPPEREKLSKVIEALKQRPQLQVVVTGYYSPDEDGQAMKDLQVRRALAERRGTPSRAGEDPGPVDFSNPKVQETLEAWYAERFGAEALEKLSTRNTAEGKSEPPDPGKRSKEIFERLVEKERLDGNVLEAVGARRAAAVAGVLSGPEGLPAERTTTKPPEAKTGKDAVSAGLALDVKPGEKTAAP